MSDLALVRRLGTAERDRLIRWAKLLAWLSLAWMTVEGAVAVTAGFLADSPALIGFGIDSAIEGIAIVIIIWRFTGARALSERTERRAQKLVAVQFFLLAPLHPLRGAGRPDRAGAPRAHHARHRAHRHQRGVDAGLRGRQAADRRPPRLRGDHERGPQNLLCAYMSAGVLVRLVANSALGAWWLDPVIALGIAALAVHEGREAWEGEECGCAAVSALDGTPPAACEDGCHDRTP